MKGRLRLRKFRSSSRAGPPMNVEDGRSGRGNRRALCRAPGAQGGVGGRDTCRDGRRRRGSPRRGSRPAHAQHHLAGRQLLRRPPRCDRRRLPRSLGRREAGPRAPAPGSARPASGPDGASAACDRGWAGPGRDRPGDCRFRGACSGGVRTRFRPGTCACSSTARRTTRSSRSRSGRRSRCEVPPASCSVSSPCSTSPPTPTARR